MPSFTFVIVLQARKSFTTRICAETGKFREITDHGEFCRARSLSNLETCMMQGFEKHDSLSKSK